MIDKLTEYFTDKGRVMSVQEYKDAEDAPIKLQLLKARIGSWGRILNMVDKQITATIIIDTVEVKPEVEPVVEPEAEPVKTPSKSKKG